MPTATAFRNIHRLSVKLHATDRLLITSWFLLSLLCLGFHSRIPFWPRLIVVNLAAVTFACALAYISQSTGSRLLRWVHDWAAFPMVVFTYKQLYFMIGPIHRKQDYDHLLIAMDRALFHVNPTEWLAHFSNPCLTEVLQIAYSLFYVFFIAVGVELYRKQSLFQFRYFRFTVVYGFLISYIGYLFLPAVGPRFTLHDFSSIHADLPGLLLTPALRRFVNAFESIPPGVLNRVALASAQRDVFPSGHVMMTLVAIVLAFKYRLSVRIPLLVMGILLTFATVYLRYHYVVDLLAGALLVLPCLLTSNRMHALLRTDSGHVCHPRLHAP